MFSTNVGGIPGPQPGDIWVSRSGTDWQRLRMSPSGQNLCAAAAASGAAISANGGVTWALRVPVSGSVTADVAQSSDGTKLLAAVLGTDNMRRSTDGGVTWAAVGALSTWRRVASSADGTVLHAASELDTPRMVTSTDSGANWTARTLPAGMRFTNVLVCSADGQTVLGTDTTGTVARSGDYGATWTTASLGAPITGLAIASSAPLVCVASTNGGTLKVSTDGGVTWASVEATRAWSGCAINSDGQRMVATVNFGDVYVSTDGGASWTPRSNKKAWTSIGCNSDATQLAGIATTVWTSTGEFS